ncbi:hypothetical protein C0Q70_10804 [Pomacea canaliculata]|uniref:Uncharacterized protein n=1 Tax=Pomacea canaliculata TaxID=400727 RepID=A0A2T7P466_POMCA|nr:hypothetical protein C0Q70_10804 [Pomacea canaliculata]
MGSRIHAATRGEEIPLYYKSNKAAGQSLLVLCLCILVDIRSAVLRIERQSHGYKVNVFKCVVRKMKPPGTTDLGTSQCREFGRRVQIKRLAGYRFWELAAGVP